MLDKAFSFSKAFIDRSTEDKKPVPMNSLRTLYSENMADVTRDNGQPE